MKQMKYENKYGTLIVEPITEFGPVASIKGADVPSNCLFYLATAEMIVLITDNLQSQIGVRPSGRCYLVVHESPSSACVARIVSLKYTGPDAEQEIERVRPRQVC
jgi:hypothetical protein